MQPQDRCRERVQKTLPSALREQLPSILSQNTFSDEELERLTQECQAEMEGDDDPANDDHLYSERHLYLRESTGVEWE